MTSWECHEFYFQCPILNWPVMLESWMSDTLTDISIHKQKVSCYMCSVRDWHVVWLVKYLSVILDRHWIFTQGLRLCYSTYSVTYRHCSGSCWSGAVPRGINSILLRCVGLTCYLTHMLNVSSVWPRCSKKHIKSQTHLIAHMTFSHNLRRFRIKAAVRSHFF